MAELGAHLGSLGELADKGSGSLGADQHKHRDPTACAPSHLQMPVVKDAAITLITSYLESHCQ